MFCALSWSEHPAPRTYEEAYERLVWTAHHWQHWLDRGDFPDHPWRADLQRSRAHAQGPDLRADRRDRRRRDHVAARDARRRAQLGLPLLAGSATRRSRSGASTRSASTGRRTTSSTSSPTWRRRRTAGCRSCTASTGAPSCPSETLDHLTRLRGRAAGARRQRRPLARPSTTSGARCSTRSTCTRKSRDHAARARVADARARRSRRRSRTGASPTAASGRCAASRSTSRRPS